MLFVLVVVHGDGAVVVVLVAVVVADVVDSCRRYCC